MTVINNRTRGLVPINGGKLELMKTATTMRVATNSWKVKMENCTVWRSETARWFAPNPGTIRAKATPKVEGRDEPMKSVSVVDAKVTPERIAEPRHTKRRTPKSALKGVGVESREEEDPETSQNVPLGIIDLESFEVLSDHGDSEYDGHVDGPSKEATKLRHRRRMPLGSGIQRFQSIMKCIEGSFGNLAMEIAETKSLHSSIVGLGSMSSMMLCSKGIFGHEAH